MVELCKIKKSNNYPFEDMSFGEIPYLFQGEKGGSNEETTKKIF